MKSIILAVTAFLALAPLSAETPNFSDARWQTVHLSMFGPTGLRVDRLTGDAWYLEKSDHAERWVGIAGPMSPQARKTMSFGDNFQVQATGSNVYLIGLRGGDSWRLADNRGKPFWRKIQ